MSKKFGIKLFPQTPKKTYNKEFEKGKKIVVLTLIDKRDTEAAIESAIEHGYKLISKTEAFFGLGLVSTSELVFEQAKTMRDKP